MTARSENQIQCPHDGGASVAVGVEQPFAHPLLRRKGGAMGIDRPAQRSRRAGLTDACAAAVTGAPPPSLLPQAPRTTLTLPLPVAA